MGVQVLWPLAFLALVPVILLLYFLKQNAKRKDFSAVMLWQEVSRSMEAVKPWERLKKNILLLLQLITVLLFVLALMGPWLSAVGREKTTVVLVLDCSASMDTAYTEDETRLEAAKERAVSCVDQLSSDSSIYVISSSSQAVLELSGGRDRAEARQCIRSISQTSLAGDLSASLGLVQSCVSQSENVRVVFFTDTAFDMGDLDGTVESFATETDNCALSGLSCSEGDEEYLVLVQASNYGNEEVSREINLYGVDEKGEETLLDIAPVTIPAGETESVYLSLEPSGIPEKTGALRAQFNETDALEGDNEACCVLDQVKTNRILLLTDSNLFLEKAFSTLAGTQILRTSDLNVFDTQESAGYDLYIFDGMLPETLPGKGNFLFVNSAADTYCETAGTREGIYLTVLDTNLTHYSADASFGVNEATVYELPAWGTALLQSGSDTAGFYGTSGGHRVAVLGFDLHETDFGLQAEFPILISELADYLLETGLTETNSCIAGDGIVLHGSEDGSTLTIQRPTGKEISVDAAESGGYYLGTEEPGLYRISQEQNGETIVQQVAVQFPSDSESHVDAAESTSQGDALSKAAVGGVLELRTLFLVLLLLMMGAEWVIYTRIS